MGGNAFKNIKCDRLDSIMFNKIKVALQERFVNEGATVCDFFPKESHGDVDIILSTTKDELLHKLQEPLIVGGSEFRMIAKVNSTTNEKENPFLGGVFVAISDGAHTFELDFMMVNSHELIQNALLMACLNTQRDLMIKAFEKSDVRPTPIGLMKKIKISDWTTVRIHITNNLQEVLEIMQLGELKLKFESEEELRAWISTCPFNKNNPLTIANDERTLDILNMVLEREARRLVFAEIKKRKMAEIKSRPEFSSLNKKEKNIAVMDEFLQWKVTLVEEEFDNCNEFFLED